MSNHYMKDNCSVDYVNGKGKNPFRRCLLEEHLRIVGNVKNSKSYVTSWLTTRVSSGDIKWLEQGIYRKEKLILESALENIQSLLIDVEDIDI